MEDRNSDECNPHPLQAVWGKYPFRQNVYPVSRNVHQHKSEDPVIRKELQSWVLNHLTEEEVKEYAHLEEGVRLSSAIDHSDPYSIHRKSLHQHQLQRNAWLEQMVHHQAEFDLELEQMDVKKKFLYGDLDETILIEQPEGFEIKGKDE